MMIEWNKQKEGASEQLWQLCEQSYYYGSPWSRAQFQNDLEQENSCYLVDDLIRPTGFVSYYQILDEIDITHVVVSKEKHGQGYGKKLLEEAISYWKQKQIKRVLLEVRASNQAAQKLYEGVGFQCIHKRKNYYHLPQEDGLMMELIL